MPALLRGARQKSHQRSALFGRADALFRHLGEAGIWVRAFRENASWLRFGLPGNEAAWKRLKAALVAFW